MGRREHSGARAFFGAARLVLPLLLATTAACTSIPIDYRLAAVTPAPRRLPTGVPVVTANFEASSQGAGPLPANGRRVADAWGTAVSDAMQRSGLFVPTGPSTLEVVVTIQGLTGIDSTDGISAAAAHYVVRFGAGGRVLLDTTILTDGRTPIDFSVTGEGQRDARNTAVRQNINRFIGALGSIDPARIAGS